MATVAVARVRPRGRLALVGLGPGARDLLTPRAEAELRRASVWVGLDQYVDQVRDLARPGTRMRRDRPRQGGGARALRRPRFAEQGHAVALLGSGDAGVYAMASPALEVAGQRHRRRRRPRRDRRAGREQPARRPARATTTRASACRTCTRPWEAIEARVRAVAEADLVVTFYNPRSRGRDWQLPEGGRDAARAPAADHARRHRHRRVAARARRCS